MEEININTGIFIEEPKDTDFMVSGETGVKKVILERNGQFDNYLPEDETQKRNLFDSLACASFSADNLVETLLTRGLSKDMPETHKKFLNDKGYISNGKVNVSDRFTAKMSDTTTKGNSLPRVANSIRNNGLVPENLYPWPGEMMDQMNYAEKWNLYYQEISQEIKDVGKTFKNFFELKYQWVLTGTFDEKKIIENLPYGPIQIAARVCSPWRSSEKDPPIQGCGCGVQHATIIYGHKEDGSLKDFDHYISFKKLLDKKYCIPYAMQYYIEYVKTVAPILFQYMFNVQQKYGDPESKEMVLIQTALHLVINPKTNLPYLKKGVFGPYGPQTRAAIAAFQENNGILGNRGMDWGPKTRRAMNGTVKILK